MAKTKYIKTRFDIKEMSKQEGYTIINNLLFKYQEQLDLDFTDLGIICKICAFSPDFSINFTKHFSSIGKRQRTERLNKLREKGYITTRKNNFKVDGSTITGGLFVSIEPLVDILNNLYKNESAEKDTFTSSDFEHESAEKDTTVKSESAEKDTSEPVESAEKDTSNNTNKYYTNKQNENLLTQDFHFEEEEQKELTEEEWIEKVNSIIPRPDITEEEKNLIKDCREYIRKRMETCENMDREIYRLFSLNQSFGPFWEKSEKYYTEADKKAKENYEFVSHYNGELNPAVDNLWLFYSDDAESFVEKEIFNKLFNKVS